MSKVLSWVNPVKNTDDTAYDAASQQAGIDIVIDGAPAVSVPVGAATEFDLTSLAGFGALKSGAHTVAIDVVTKTGVHSDLSGAASFSLEGKPLAPTNLAVA